MRWLITLLARLIKYLDSLTADIGFYDGTHWSNQIMTTITNEQKYTLTAVGKTVLGNPVPFSTVPTWTTSDPAIASVVPALDGLSANVISVGALGTATITVEADGHTATDVVTVVAGTLDHIDLVASEPVAR